MMKSARAFTLAELLIAIGILGIVVIFTIPKVLEGSNNITNNKYKAIAKSAMTEVSNAYVKYRLDNAPLATTKPDDISPYLNYVRLDTVSIVDDKHNDASNHDCSSSVYRCFQLHSGGVLHYRKDGNGPEFGGMGTTNAVYMYIDPDGKDASSATGPGTAVQFFLYYNGQVRTRGNIKDATCDQLACRNADATADPPWYTLD